MLVERLALPVDPPEARAASSASAWVTDAMPEPFLATLIQTPSADAPDSSSHASQSPADANVSVGSSAALKRRRCAKPIPALPS